MQLELKGFQDIAAAELLTHLRAARREATDFSQALLLSAPTGAGKTVIATAVIEALFEGDADLAGSSQSTVLWLTDMPELNEQTKRKMKFASSILNDSNLVTIEPSFREKILSSGRVYFLNTQKLGRNSGLANPWEESSWTLWDTLRKTIEERPQDFLLIIDEAHRGMAESAREAEQAKTIVQKFIKGSEGELPPVPMIMGISATPERFRAAIDNKRTLRPQVEVLAEEVRKSGLLKQTLLVYHPKKKVPSDFTLLQAAAERLAAYRESWQAYEIRTQSGESVEPMLVVQVANAPSGRGGGVTETDMALALSVVEATLGHLDEKAIAHSFQEGITLPVGDGRMLRYVAPSDIQDDPNLRLVFFKSALTTGWDCPRAEVMMSFRKAVDHTLIAQLIGRMVRTPLARTIEDDEFLNTVSLYLPHYEKAGIDKVFGRLQLDDPEFLPPIDVQLGEERAKLHRDPKKQECFDTLGKLPTYDVVRVRATTSLRRSIKLARLLDRDLITTDGLEAFVRAVVGVLCTARLELEHTEWWGNVVRDSGTLDLRTVEWSLGPGLKSETASQIPVTQQNVEELFAAAGRRLGEGLHKAYWRARSEEDPSQRIVRRIAKLEIFAMSQTPEVVAMLESFADDSIDSMQREHGAEIEALPPDRKDGYNQVRLTARNPESRSLGVFESIEGQASGPEWSEHIYLNEEDQFHYKFKSSWEPMVLEEAMGQAGFVGWLRVEDRKDWALTIPYLIGSDTKPLYPDLIVFRKVKGRVVADILDPHDPTREDWRPKVRGLATYASKHGASFGKIEASFIERTTIRRLDLTVERNWKAALEADGVNSLRNLFI